MEAIFVETCRYYFAYITVVFYYNDIPNVTEKTIGISILTAHPVSVDINVLDIEIISH